MRVKVTILDDGKEVATYLVCGLLLEKKKQ